jgi:hypothetical protein
LRAVGCPQMIRSIMIGLAKINSQAAYESAANIATERYGQWIQVYSGGKFYPLDPHPDEVFIEDIAHALSMLCRYTGHINKILQCSGALLARQLSCT